MTVKNTRQRSANLVPFFMRMPPELRQEIEQRSKSQGTSQAAVAVELMQRGLNKNMDQASAVRDWLDRNRPA